MVNKSTAELFLIITLFSSCTQKDKSSQQHDTKAITIEFKEPVDAKVEQVLTQAIEAAGGWENWKALDSMRYLKKSILYLEDGTKESEATQEHFFTFKPRFKATIIWLEDEQNRRIEYQEGSAKKYSGDSLIEENTSAIKESVMSAVYVLAQPFKLLDVGTTLEYQGLTKTKKGKKAFTISATYNPKEYINHSTKDSWWYYFDTEDGKFLESMVYHAPTYALIENVSFWQELPIHFHKHRKSYRADSLRNIKFLRAEFDYWDYELWLK